MSGGEEDNPAISAVSLATSKALDSFMI